MNNQIEKIRHSLSHLMASAVWQMFPPAKFGIGPVIENGFYYDFDLPRNLTPDDLPKIEKKMKELIKQDIKFERLEISIGKAKEVFKNQPYKLELIDELSRSGGSSSSPILRAEGHAATPSQIATVYRSGKFIDLCAGPHVLSTKEINAESFKLTKIAGAYWRGDEKNKMLQRIYGLAFATKKELDEHLKLQEEVKKRDHRKLGQEMDLFSFHSVSPGAPFWHPRGMVIFKELEKFWREIHDENGYQETSTPILNKKELWEKSGHWELYKENMFRLKIENQEYGLKPMNCPGSTYIYSSKLRSYKDLPIRLSEIGRLFRNEITGALGGMFRVRQITMDDAHIYCRPDQIEEEITGVIKLVKKFYSIFKFKPQMVLSTMPTEHLGEKKSWEQAEKALMQALKKNKLTYQTNPGEGAFYGPKIDVIIKDGLGRDWQMATIQLDFQLPQRFELSYTDEKGQKQRPVIIHRAIFGTFERFLSILLEQTAGNLPLWLMPCQVKVINVGKAHRQYCQQLGKKLEDEGIRIELDLVNETVPYRVRKAEQQKVPYILVIGDKEKKGKSLNVRIRRQKQMKKMTVKSFVEKIKKEIEGKK